MGAEERMLKQDPHYRAYAERVRYRLIPGVYSVDAEAGVLRRCWADSAAIWQEDVRLFVFEDSPPLGGVGQHLDESRLVLRADQEAVEVVLVNKLIDIPASAECRVVCDLRGREQLESRVDEGLLGGSRPRRGNSRSPDH